MAGDYDVHVGSWTNWSQGRFLGATLTLTRQDGSLLMSFLALFVALVGLRLWRILCFFLHGFYSSPSPRDGLHHQRQAVLRTAANPDNGIYSVANLLWSWRSRATRVWLRLLPVLALAVLCFCAMTLSTGYSSRIASTVSTDVLLTGARCGYMDLSLAADNLTTVMEVFVPTRVQDLISADTYARQCYTSGSTKSEGLGCGLMVKQQLKPEVVDTRAACPFHSRVCQSNNSNLLVDTGYLNSHEHFGRNARPEERFQYRRVLHCSPLASEGYTSISTESANESYIRYHYGSPIPAINLERDNYTIEFPRNVSVSYEEMQSNGGDTKNDYTIRFDLAFGRNGSIHPKMSSFNPIPELSRPDADVYLFFLTASGVIFSQPVLDPWYKATTPYSKRLHQLSSLAGNISIFMQDEPGSPLACAEQNQLCWPGSSGNNKCTPLMSFNDLVDIKYLSGLFDDEEQRHHVEWMLNTTIAKALQAFHPIAVMGNQALTARTSITGGHQAPLPNNQWQREVQHWHSSAIAHLQRQFVEAVTGPRDPRLETTFRFANSPTEKQLCSNQKVLVSDYVSFSIFGLSAILAGGALLIAFSWALEPLARWLRARKGSCPYSLLEWTINGAFQLQRLAYEGHGIGTWSRTTDAVPVTQPGEDLGVLDISDPRHPRLQRTESRVTVFISEGLGVYQATEKV
ncbi:hypothetical protein QBC34DRAFT_307051 [Podospora aff. communis PSN243]|uniref:Uncharacterized protein n=1 Tax=Podospora aff. communis PSN243 TaxID=3040156 RepID=A0AAV9GBI8_9PEZI|nr:hypothetical protein QBC34DRAFT_307051 [Podospora aff. communis PSN243]